MSEIIKPKFSENRYLPDSSVIISGKFINFLRELHFDGKVEVILSRIVLAEIENKANQEKTTGLIGLKMLHVLMDFINEDLKSQGKDVEIIAYGDRPSFDQIRLNSGGELDAAIRKHAIEIGATIVTSDKVQGGIAKIEQIPTYLLESDESDLNNQIQGKRIQDFFDDTSMSVLLKTNCIPKAKKGRPGKWNLVNLGDEKLTIGEIKQIESNIITEAENDPESFIEKDMTGVTVVQLRNFRIVICRPPFSDGNEITAVKPLVRLHLDDYNQLDPLMSRLDRAEGILVAGVPGAGKSTFISALTDFYLEKNKVVKTLESVRDLQVPPEVSQYSELEGDFEKTADILLLVRPDFTIFDEIRTSGDFKIFADMRLAGVGMVGVIHAASALDAIQRFIRRIEMGVLPSVVDTVIFIKNGQIDEILKLGITVKVPSGFRDQGLARPVIEVSNYVTNKVLYEIYEFGSNVVVTPVKRGGNRQNSSGNYDQFSKNGRNGRNYNKRNTSYKKGKKGNSNDRGSKSKFSLDYQDELMDNPLEDAELKNLTGKDDYLKNIESIDEVEVEESQIKGSIELGIVFGKKSLILKAGIDLANKYLDIYEESNFIASMTLNKNGELRIDKKTHLFRKIDTSIREGRRIFGILSD